eukprot:402081_1
MTAANMLDKPHIFVSNINYNDSNDEVDTDTEDTELIENMRVEELTIRIETNWSKLKQPYGILSIFGFVYWLFITIITFIIEFEHALHTSLFKWSIICMLLAFVCQCGIVILLVLDFENEIIRFYNIDFKFLCITIFPYSLLICVDLCIHIQTTFSTEKITGKPMAFIIFHIINLFFLSLLEFKWGLKKKVFRIINFAFEWFDIFSQILVI